MTKFLLIFTSFMINGDILHKNLSYFSFSTELECRSVELVTMGKNDRQNCQARFTAFPNNNAEEISKTLDTREDV